MKFKRFLCDITTRIDDAVNEDAELEQTLSDFIEMYIENGNKEKEAHYRRIYREKFGKDYQQHKEFVPKPSLDKIYSKKDFDRYQDYIKYADELFRLKWKAFSSKIKNISKPEVTPDQAIDFYKSLGIEMNFGNVKGTEEAHVRSGKVTFRKQYENRKIPKEVIIHELGHILDEKLSNISAFSDLFLHNMKSSVYDLSPVEIFAEGFLNYSVNPNFLKAGWKDVYDYFDRKVPGNWKKAIKELIKL
jgi:hypothetical protein